MKKHLLSYLCLSLLYACAEDASNIQKSELQPDAQNMAENPKDQDFAEDQNIHIDQEMVVQPHFDMQVTQDAEVTATDAEVVEDMSPLLPPTEECYTNERFFEEKIWRPIVKELCLDCHNPQGSAQATEMVYVPDSQAGALRQNYYTFSNIASYDRNGEPVVLLKPSAQIAHSGGRLFTVESAEYQAIAEMVQRTRNPEPVRCAEVVDQEQLNLFNGLKLLDAQKTLRRASLSIAGRMPRPQEELNVAQYGWTGLEVALNEMMREEGFYRRIKEIWNDILLTEKYLGRSNAIDLLNANAYPRARWFLTNNGMAVDPNAPQDPLYWSAPEFSNDSLAREPLEHIAFVLRNDRPFGEIISADYIAVNPYTAKMYNINDLNWHDPLDPNEYQEGRIVDFPHAGILSSPMILNRFPTTDTNRNRHRARIFFKNFLNLDVLKLAERPINPTSTAHNPTMNDPQCSICHTVIDPVAGAFQHFDAQGSFSFRETWYGDMRAPGFDREEVPFDVRRNSLGWLAQKTVEDDRFDLSMVTIHFTALVGQAPIGLPVEGDTFYDSKRLAFEVQQKFLNDLAAGFKANHQDLRWLFKEIVKSVYFRAYAYDGVFDPNNASDLEHMAKLSHLGLSDPLTPEQLNRKIYYTTGYRWAAGLTNLDYLLDENGYKMLYGGIDSDDVVERIKSPSGIFANIQQRMSNEVACKVTSFDFTKPMEERVLFPFVTPNYVPEDSNGFPIPQAQTKIRQNLIYLAWRLWGEVLTEGDQKLEDLYQLYDRIWQIGKAGIADGSLSSSLHWACNGYRDINTYVDLPNERRVTADPNYTIRTWEALMTVFLNDPAFLYE
jgi:hypothetical protein